MTKRCFIPGIFRVLGVAPALLVACLAQPAPGDGAAPDPPANLQALIDAAVAEGRAQLVLPPGTYRLAPSAERRPHLLLRSARGLTIVADGVTVVCTEPEQAFKMEGCEDVTVRGLTIDYDPLLYTQGVIVAVDPARHWFEVRLDAGYPDSAGATGRAIIYEPGTLRVKPDTWTRYGAVLSQRDADGGGRIVRVDDGRAIQDAVAVGDLVSVTRPTRTPHAVLLERCGGVTVQDVTVHGSTSFGFFESNATRQNRYTGCRVVPGPPPPGATAPRLLTSNADAFHSKHAKVGPIVEECFFQRQGDDGIAINGDFGVVLAREAAGGRQRAADDGAAGGAGLIVTTRREPLFAPGDRLRGISRAGQVLPDAKVLVIEPVERAGGEPVRSIVAAHYPNLRRAENQFTQAYRVRLDRALPLKEGDLFSCPDRNGSGFVVRNNRIENHRARGILVKASNGLIENNVIDGSSMAGIVLCPEPDYWLEADFSKDVVIRANTVRNTGYAARHANNLQAGAIAVVAVGAEPGKPWPAGGHRNVRIEDNRIERAVGANLVVTSASDVIIRGNRFVEPHHAPGGTGKVFGITGGELIWISDSSSVTVADNTVTGAGPHQTDRIKLTESAQDVQGAADGVKPLTHTSTGS